MSLITEVHTDIVIEIRTINDDLKDFDRLFQIWNKANQGQSEIILDFSKCYFLRQDECNESYQVRQTFFEGTLVNITLKCDESYYYLECNPDLDDQPLF